MSFNPQSYLQRALQSLSAGQKQAPETGAWVIRAHSTVDLITNSSSELYICNTDKTLETVREMLMQMVANHLSAESFDQTTVDNELVETHFAEYFDGPHVALFNSSGAHICDNWSSTVIQKAHSSEYAERTIAGQRYLEEHKLAQDYPVWGTPHEIPYTRACDLHTAPWKVITLKATIETIRDNMLVLLKENHIDSTSNVEYVNTRCEIASNEITEEVIREFVLAEHSDAFCDNLISLTFPDREIVDHLYKFYTDIVIRYGEQYEYKANDIIVGSVRDNSIPHQIGEQIQQVLNGQRFRNG